ncbi:MAG: DinB family protein [Bacteroidota bacterium]
MKVKLTIKSITLWLFSYCFTALYAQEDVFLNDFVERLEQSKAYMMLVSEAMPEDKYDYKATADSLSFAENLMHIGYAMDWHCQSLLGGRAARDWQTDTWFKIADRSKEEMIDIIIQTFDETISFIKEFDSKLLEDELEYFGFDRSKRQILLLLADHITHHRAQMLVDMRLNGLVPPRYVLYQ